MAGQLIQVATETVTTPVSSVVLNGIDSDDVYMLAYTGANPSVNADNLAVRVNVSGTADTTSNYDYAYKNLITNTTFGNLNSTNNTKWDSSAFGNNATTGKGSGIYYLYNLFNASEYSFVTVETINEYANTTVYRGQQGGGVHTVAQSCNGVTVLFPAGNINAGTFTLYKVV